MRFETGDSDWYDEELVRQSSEETVVLRGLLQHWIAGEALRHTGTAPNLLGLVWSNQDRWYAMNGGEESPAEIVTAVGTDDAGAARTTLIFSLTAYALHCSLDSNEHIAAEELSQILHADLRQ